MSKEPNASPIIVPMMLHLGSALTFIGSIFLFMGLFRSSNYLFFGGEFAGYPWYVADAVASITSLVAAGSLVRAGVITQHEDSMRALEQGHTLDQ